ncbi:MAG: aminotransferase class I/II-fold pyridoxal phosphate-dependent enzyme [Acidobacteria bacterium]|jgi:aspartate/methionine/tyrosine aminotransferase|nr:aminotransferase class I/II-fold pyridoxal phosphate-dependent enzyme [Acidobacteriota bacterium]
MKIKDFRLERFFARFEFTAPYLLCTSDCESFTIEELLSLEKNSANAFHKLHLGYTETLGNLELRLEISKLYANARPEDILVLAGAEEGIFIFMNALLEPGDHIIVQSPCYQSLSEVATAIGCNVTEWFMDAQNNWELDLDFLKKNITPRTRAIVVNFPNTPTGYTMPPEMFNELIEIARRHDIYIFSDEVYRFLEYDPRDRIPAACDRYDKAVSLGVMSKSFGLPGLRIGWLATRDKSLYQKIASFKDYTTICCSAPGEFLAALALRNKEYILARNLDIIKSNLQLLENFFKKYANLFEWVKPRAGLLIFPHLLFEQDAETFCLDLVNKKGVLLLPASVFNYENHYVRFGFGRRNMPEALRRLEEYLLENPLARHTT